MHIRTIYNFIPFKNFKRKISRCFSHQLLATNITISLALSGVGDIIQQNCKDDHKYNLTRTFNMGITGISTGFLCHFWYEILDRKLPGRDIKTIGKKVFLDQIILSPACITVFIITLSMMRSINHLAKNIHNHNLLNSSYSCSDNTSEKLLNSSYSYSDNNEYVIKLGKDLRVNGLKLYLADWIVWPPAQVINFYFLPHRFRVLYDNVISLLFDVYSSYVVHDNDTHEDTLEQDL